MSQERQPALFFLAAILVLAAFFRFNGLAEIPPGLYPDEAANGNNAVEALRTGEFKVFYPENNGREGLFINLQALSVKLFGAEPGALRLVSALVGTLTVLGIYLVGRELFPIPQQKAGTAAPLAALDRRVGTVPERSEGERGGRVSSKSSETGRFRWREMRLASEPGILSVREGAAVPLLSAFFLATSFWHLNFSRIGFRAIMVPFFSVFAMYWLLKALRTGKVSSAILGGLAAGLGLHTYIAFRFMPFVLAVPMGWYLFRWLRNRQAQSVSVRQRTDMAAEPCAPCIAVVFLFAALIVTLPIGLYFFGHPEDFLGRSGQVSIFSAESPLREFVKSSALTLGMFNVYGDCNARHNLSCEPELFWPVGVLFLAGAALTVRGLFRRPLSLPAYTLLAWFLFLALPAALTREGLPHALRAIGLIPPVMLIAARGGAWLWQTLRDAVARAIADPVSAAKARQLRRIGIELAAAAVLFLVWIPVGTYSDYFIRFARSPATADAFAADLLAIGRYAAALPDETQKIIVVNLAGDDIRGVPAPAQTVMFASDTFEAERRLRRNLTYVTDVSEIRIDAARPAVIIPLNREDRGTTRAIRERFPALRARVVGGALVFERR